jgi:hypothetical protein
MGVVNVLTKNMFSAFRFQIPLLLFACGWLVAFCVLPAVAIVREPLAAKFTAFRSAYSSGDDGCVSSDGKALRHLSLERGACAVCGTSADLHIVAVDGHNAEAGRSRLARDVLLVEGTTRACGSTMVMPDCVWVSRIEIEKQ